MILNDEALTRHCSYLRENRKLLFVILVSLLSLLFDFHVSASAQDDPDTDILRVRTDFVTVPAFVVDKNGRRVTGLTALDFELRDNGDVVNLEYFATGTERVALVFALDASGSTRDVISQQRDVASALLMRFGPGSEVAVIQFAENAKLVSDFSITRDGALRAFDFPALANRRTAIFDSVLAAIHTFDGRQTDKSERRIIILISDGLDTVSRTSSDKVIAKARELGVSIYAIQIPLYSPRDGQLKPREATKGFREMAEKTGGRFFMAGSENSALAIKPSFDLSPIFQAIEDDLRGQYMFGYYPDEAAKDGRFHRIEIKLKLKDRRKLRIHSLRVGYYSKS